MPGRWLNRKLLLLCALVGAGLAIAMFVTELRGLAPGHRWPEVLTWKNAWMAARLAASPVLLYVLFKLALFLRGVRNELLDVTVDVVRDCVDRLDGDTPAK